MTTATLELSTERLPKPKVYPLDLSDPTLPDAHYVREDRVLTVIPVSRATFWRMVKRGTFPQPRKLSSKVSVWTIGSLRQWQRGEQPQPT